MAIVHELGDRKIVHLQDTCFGSSDNGQRMEIVIDDSSVQVSMSPVTCADVCLLSSYCRRLGKRTLRFIPLSEADREQLRVLGMPEFTKDVYEHIRRIRWFAPPSIAERVAHAVGLDMQKRQGHEKNAQILIGPVAKIDLSRDHKTAVAVFFTDSENPLDKEKTYSGITKSLLSINLMHVPLAEISSISDYLSCFEKRRR